MDGFDEAVLALRETPADALVQALARSPERNLRAAAAQVLGARGERSPAVLDALLRAMRDPEFDVFWEAAQALAKLGAGNPEVEQALRLAGSDFPDEAGAGGTALLALERVDADSVSRVVAGALDGNREYAVRHCAAALDALGWMRARDLLLAGLTHAELEVRQRCVEMLWTAPERLGLAASPAALAALRGALADPGLKVRVYAARLLLDLGERPDAVGLALEVLDELRLGARGASELQALAAGLLGDLGEARPEIVRALRRVYLDARTAQIPQVHKACRAALEKLGALRAIGE